MENTGQDSHLNTVARETRPPQVTGPPRPGAMLDILSSPLRGYIAQTLQFYLSKYIEGIQLEGLGLFGGDLVLNDLEIKRHVLLESLEIPSSFDFSRGFIRELRIHIPWTQLLSQPIEVKLYTVELILTARDGSNEAASRRASRSRSFESPPARDPAPPPPEIETPKSGWLRDTLHKILVNLSVQINNLVLKYEQDDVVLSVALGSLDCYAVNDKKAWLRAFTDPQGPAQVICRVIDARDLTIFLDRYASDRKASDLQQSGAVHRRVVGYELPVLSRSTISIRGRLALKPDADQDGATSASVKSRTSAALALIPSKACDPFFQYSCSRSSLAPTTEIDVFVGELAFSLSDRQLAMLGELLNRTIHRRAESASRGDQEVSTLTDDESFPQACAEVSVKEHDVVVNSDKLITGAAETTQEIKKRSWMSWAMGALGGPQDDEDDELISEILAETNEALRRSSEANKLSASAATSAVKASNSFSTDTDTHKSVCRILCFRMCINSTVLTLRRHDVDEEHSTRKGSDPEDQQEEEQFVPVANVGLVKVTTTRANVKTKQSKPASEVCSLSMTYSALEVVLTRSNDMDVAETLVDLVFEVERVKMVNLHEARTGNLSDHMLVWGNALESEQGHGPSSIPFSDCVSHPYFVSSFFGEQARQHGRRESRSFEIVKLSQDVEIPVWKTIEHRKSSQFPAAAMGPTTSCECSIIDGEKQTPCVPLSRLLATTKEAVSLIGIHDRNINHVGIRAVLKKAWESQCRNFRFDFVNVEEDLHEICETYQALRDPDSPAMRNLNQLLTPMLYRLLARLCLHSCYLINGSGDSERRGDFDVRSRSVHSALRLRYVGTKSTPADDSASKPSADSLDAKEESSTIQAIRTRSVLDASLGPLVLSIDPNQLVDTVDLLCLASEKRQNSAHDDSVDENLPAVASRTKHESCQLLTLHSALGSATVCDLPTTFVHIMANDCSWFASKTMDDEWRRRLALGRASLTISTKHAPVDDAVQSAPLVQFLASTWASSGCADPRTEATSTVTVGRASASILWNHVWQSLSALDRVLHAVRRQTLGFDGQVFSVQKPRRLVCVEICNWRLHRVTRMPREGSADRVVDAVLGSSTIYSTRSGGGSRQIVLQMGCTPFVGDPGEPSAFIPMLSFRLQESKSRQHSHVDVRGQIALATTSFHDLEPCLPDALDFLQCVRTRHAVSTEDVQSKLTPEPSDIKVKYWNIVTNFQFEGAIVRVTQALDFTMARVVVETDPALHNNRRDAIEQGGSMKLMVSCGELKLVNKWRSSMRLANNQVQRDVILLQGVSASVLYTQDFVSSKERISVDISAEVKTLQVALDRLSMRHLLRFVSTINKRRGVKEADTTISNRAEATRHQSLRLGIQLGDLQLSSESDIVISSKPAVERVTVMPLIQVKDFVVAVRNASYRPKTDFTEMLDRQFTDIQLSIASIEARELHKTHVWRADVLQGSRRFGSLGRVSDRDFLDILLCLDERDLSLVTSAFGCDDITLASSEISTIASWHAVNRLARLFHKWSSTFSQRVERLAAVTTTSVPLIATAANSASTGVNAFPVVSVYFRNYGEIRDVPRTILAASVDNIDIVLSPTTLASVATLLGSEGSPEDSSDLPPSQDSRKSAAANFHGDQGHQNYEIQERLISIVTGRARLLLPNMDWILLTGSLDSSSTRKALQQPCACLVLDHATVSSSTWHEISLDGLGYPPFNAALLPRRISKPLQLRRITSDTPAERDLRRLTGRLANISGAMVKWDSSESSELVPGPIDLQLGRMFDLKFVSVETAAFIYPFSITVVQETANARSKRHSTNVSVTKVRAEMSKAVYDKLVGRGLDITRAVVASNGSGRRRSKRSGMKDDQTQSRRSGSRSNLELSCDGLDFVAAQAASSIHVRVGSLLIQQVIEEDSEVSGTFSLQNLVVALRGSNGATSTTEMLVLGPNSDPTAWQLDVDNTPHKLLSGRWTNPASSSAGVEPTLFIDIQGAQAHVSSAFFDEAMAFLIVEKNEPSALPVHIRDFSKGGKTTGEFQQHTQPNSSRKLGVKLLIGPSVTSVWVSNERSQVGSAVWGEFDQVFTSIEVGGISDEALLSQSPSMLDRFVLVPGAQVAVTVDKIALRTSSSYEPLAVSFKTDTLSTIPGQIQSSWSVFSRVLCQTSARTTVLQETTIRISANRRVVLERGSDGTLLRTPLSSTSLHIEPSALSFKISAASLASLLQFVDGCNGVHRKRREKHPEKHDDRATESIVRSHWAENLSESSNNDLAVLRHRTERASSPPHSGDIVFSEVLLIETAMTGPHRPVDVIQGDLAVAFAPSRTHHGDEGEDGAAPYDETAEVLRWIELVNEPWSPLDSAGGSDESFAPVLIPDTQTVSWMSMKWCYHLPRKVTEIEMNPVPVPPTGAPSDWPVWFWKDETTTEESQSFARLCDFVCELRAWDAVNCCYVVVAEFYVPWENPATDDSEQRTLKTKGSFGDLMSVFFDEVNGDEDQVKFDRVMEVTCSRRVLTLNDTVASDNWELRWRSPLSSEQDKQRRVHVSALLAASLNVRSQLVESAVQRATILCTLPHVSIAVAHVQGNEDASHDVIAAGLSDTHVSLVSFAGDGGSVLVFKTALQVAFDNIAQLLTVPILPRIELYGLIERNERSGTLISLRLGDVHVYLPQSAILLLSSLSDILKTDSLKSRVDLRSHGSSLPILRVQFVNACGRDVWYRQSGTRECLQLRAGESDAYCWATLEGDPFYDCVEFALGTERQQLEPLQWCDPCRIREQATTGRYFQDAGFLWIAVERSGTMTIVHVQGAINVVNFLPDSVRLQLGHSPSKTTVVDCPEDAASQPWLARVLSNGGASSVSRQPNLLSLRRAGVMVDASSFSLQLSVNGKKSISSIEEASLLSSHEMVQVTGLPVEFDPVNTSDTGDEAKRHRRRRTLRLESLNALKDQAPRPVFVVVEVTRAVQPATMPDDFYDTKIALRYTWVDIFVLPSVQIINCCTVKLTIGLYGKDEHPEEMELEAQAAEFCTALDPQSLRGVTLLSSGSVTATCNIENVAQGGAYHLGSVCVEIIPPSVGNPFLKIMLREHVLVINNSSMRLRLKFRDVSTEQLQDSHLEAPPTVALQVDPSSQASPRIGSLLTAKGMMSLTSLGVSVATCSARGSGNEEDGEFSAEVALELSAGHTSVLCCPALLHDEQHAEEQAHYSYPFVVSVQICAPGETKITISPLVTVHNNTGLRLKLSAMASTLSGACGQGVGLDEMWEVPVRHLALPDKNRAGSGVTSWLSSALGFGGKTRASSFAFGTTGNQMTTCSFRATVSNDSTEDGEYAWTEKIPVRVPEVALMTQFSQPTLKTIGYSRPTSVLPRHQRLVRHTGMRHVMVTIAISQLDDMTTHVVLFIDRQAPIAFENLWSYPLGIRVMASQVMTPDAIAGRYYMEYDWSIQRRSGPRSLKTHQESVSLQAWLSESSKAFEGEQYHSDPLEQQQKPVKFQLGLPGFGWSSVLWQVPGIQFARFATKSTVQSPVFLVATSYRAGTWSYSISCLDDPTSQADIGSNLLESQIATHDTKPVTALANRFRLIVSSELVQIHCCDEHSIAIPERVSTNAVAYKEIFRLSLRAPCVSFVSSVEAPAALQNEARLGYTKHVRSYSALFAGLAKIEVEHFLDACNFPVMLALKDSQPSHDEGQMVTILTSARQAHDRHLDLLSCLLSSDMPGEGTRCLAIRVINVDPWDRARILPYLHSVEVKLAPAVIQVDDEILIHFQDYINPITDALSAKSFQPLRPSSRASSTSWRSSVRCQIRVTSQQRVFIDHLQISDLEVTVTARMSIPVLSSLDGTPLRFSARQMHRVFAFSDQLIKDLAAEYVADILVRSPLLIMSLNIIGNPAGFLRSIGTGVRDLFEIPITIATRDGFNPWVLTRGVFGGIASLVGHTSAAALSSLSGFSYSISRTVDHLILTPEQLRRRHYVRPTHLSSGIKGGLGSLGSSVVGAATGIVSTPMALYQEKRDQGRRAGVGDVLGGFGMGLVGIVARPMGGLASLLAMTSDGILNGTGMGEQMSGEMDFATRAAFEARPNDELRAKLKILRDASVGDLVLAHGAWVDPSSDMLRVPAESLRALTALEMKDERVQELFSEQDGACRNLVVSVICTKAMVVVVGTTAVGSDSSASTYNIIAKAPVVGIHTIEESLTEPARLDIGVRSNNLSAWFRLRITPKQRRHLSHNLRQWVDDAHGRGFSAA